MDISESKYSIPDETENEFSEINDWYSGIGHHNERSFIWGDLNDSDQYQGPDRSHIFTSPSARSDSPDNKDTTTKKQIIDNLLDKKWK